MTRFHFAQIVSIALSASFVVVTWLPTVSVPLD